MSVRRIRDLPLVLDQQELHQLRHLQLQLLLRRGPGAGRPGPAAATRRRPAHARRARGLLAAATRLRSPWELGRPQLFGFCDMSRRRDPDRADSRNRQRWQGLVRLAVSPWGCGEPGGEAVVSQKLRACVTEAARLRHGGCALRHRGRAASRGRSGLASGRGRRR